MDRLKLRTSCLLLIMATLVLTACVTTSQKMPVQQKAQAEQKKMAVALNPIKRPKWLERETEQYPNAQYLTGVGSGSNHKKAGDAAYSALALTFQANIQSVRETREHINIKIRQGDESVLKDVEMDENILISTDKVLENVRIAESWIDERDGLVYALAVMERKQASRMLRARIEQQDQKIQSLVNQSRQSSDKIEMIRALRKAKAIALSREVNNIDLRVISTGEDFQPTVSLLEIDNNLQLLLSQKLKLAVSVEGQHHDTIRSAIVEALTRDGFSINPALTGQNSDIFVKGQTHFEKANLPQWKFVRWSIRVDIFNQRTGKIFASLAKEGREGHLNFVEAEAKAATAMQDMIVLDLGRQIIDFINDEES